MSSSSGILAWELLSGLPLFEGKDLKSILAAVRRADAPELRKLNSEVPAYLSDAVATALNPKPGERGTVGDLGGHLARASRELSAVSSSHALAEWLDELFPRPTPEPTRTEIQTAAPATSDSEAMIEESDPTMTGPKVALVEELFDSPATLDPLDASSDDTAHAKPKLSTLLDKRRVVVAVLLLSGGPQERRRELSLVLGDLAYKRGAVVHERNDDELVAIFGLEVAGEDDVANAMHFGLEACALAREGGGESGRAISLRSAARAGVVAQRRQGDYHVRSDAFREARELARDAEANRPLLSGGTGRLASAQFRFRELPARRYRSRRLRVLELLGPRTHDDRARSLLDRRGRFVGRERELAALWGAYSGALSERKQTSALIYGTTGVGKSRLLAEFVARVDENSHPPFMLAVAAMDSAADAPFSVATEYLQAALKVAPGRGESTRAELLRRLARVLRDAGMSDERVSDACSVVELALELRDGALSKSKQPSAAFRERFADTLAVFHAALTRGRPSVTLLENLHLADGASLEVLRAILRKSPESGPNLVLISSRDQSLAEVFKPETLIELGDLPDSERRELISDRLGDSKSEEVIAAVAQRAGGTPLYIEELCRAVRDIGWVETPATVRDSIVARIDRLSKTTRAVLQRAAVIGASFRSRILEELIAAPAQDHLQELIEEGLLIRTDQAELEAEDGMLSFRHGLIQEVVYESLSASARKATHARLGELLVSRDEAGRNEPPAVIARHLELGGRLPEAAKNWTRAGRIALAASESQTARDAFDHALSIHKSLEGGSVSIDGDQRFEALFGRAKAFGDLGEFAQQERDLEALESGSLTEGSSAEILNCKADLLLRKGAFEEAVATATRAAEAAKASTFALAEGEALRIIGEAHERMGQYEKALEIISQALSVFERLDAPEQEMRARISMARNHLTRSHYAEARGIYQPILSTLERHHDPWIERIACNHLAAIHLCLGEFEEAMVRAERSVSLCEVDGDQARAGDNHSICGIILHEVGQYEAAQKRYQVALKLHSDTNSRWSRSDTLIYAGFNEAMLGNFEGAFNQVREARDEAIKIKSPYVECNANIALAGLHLLSQDEDNLESALEAAERALGLARETQLTGAEAMALSRQAEALRRLGRSTEALECSFAAVKILDRQRHLEGSEEEILYHHYLLQKEALPESAAATLARAVRGFERKLAGIEQAEWQRSFCEDIALHQDILQAQEEL